ncbi:MAG: hypothetical protein Q9174_000468 [Haloplaca sp. 1 TL-2023]
MSSRALRKIQREREQEQQKQVEEQPEESREEESEDDQPVKPQALNAFDLLTQDEDDEHERDSEEDDVGMTDPPSAEETGTKVKQPMTVNPSKLSSKSKTKKKKKKKEKKKARHEDDAEDMVVKGRADDSNQLDEIDLALQSLSVQSASSHGDAQPLSPLEDFSEMHQILAVDSKNLNPTNEMKRLFGNVALERENDEPGQARRRGRAQHLDLGGALAGRNSPVSRGQGLAGLALRRNVFIAGKEEWPKATSGGLGMEFVEKLSDGTLEYRFIHNTVYQDVQRQFETCVESMDPQRMIQLLQFNPYHISTLLQVSEIAKQQGDHSVSGDLLERALFSFGRSVHSSFTTALSQGKARLDFRLMENREFWLAAWRYIANLGQRGTWRTTYEWAKLVFSLDPEGDPFGMGLILDQLAIRGGQAEHFLGLVNNRSISQFMRRSSIYISEALAEYKVKNSTRARVLLREAISRFSVDVVPGYWYNVVCWVEFPGITHCFSTAYQQFPYPHIFLRLFQELNLDRLPKSIWGQKPRTAREEFDSEVYVHNSKDLWNTPEAISLLAEVAESVERNPDPPRSDNDITLEEARHILLSGTPSLIRLIPRTFTTMSSSSSDLLPPPDSLPSYLSISSQDDPQGDGSPSRIPPAQAAIPELPRNETLADDEMQELRGLQGFFSRISPWFRSNSEPDADEEIERVASEAGVPQEVITERSSRLVQLLQRALGRAVVDEASQAQAQQSPESRDHSATEPALAERPEAEADELVDLPEVTSTANAAERRTDEDTYLGEEPYDDARNQRWLAGQGMMRLRDFTGQHGTDDKAWGAHTSEGETLISQYARNVLRLRHQRTRDFIVNYPLQQGTSTAVRDLVRRQIERQQR